MVFPFRYAQEGVVKRGGGGGYGGMLPQKMFILGPQKRHFPFFQGEVS